MDQNFQTSFIPKKPIIEERVTSSEPVGVLFIVSIFILFVVLLGTGGLYFYKLSVQNHIASMKKSLVAAKGSFEQSKIIELQKLDNRLSAATEVLDKHLSVTPIFSELEKITMHSVRFTNFSYAASASSGNLNVQMSGIAVGYRSVALQSDIFGADKNFINPVFSNLTLDDKGNVLFNLNFSVVPSFVNYKTLIQPQS